MCGAIPRDSDYPLAAGEHDTYLASCKWRDKVDCFVV